MNKNNIVDHEEFEKILRKGHSLKRKKINYTNPSIWRRHLKDSWLFFKYFIASSYFTVMSFLGTRFLFFRNLGRSRNRIVFDGRIFYNNDGTGLDTKFHFPFLRQKKWRKRFVEPVLKDEREDKRNNRFTSGIYQAGYFPRNGHRRWLRDQTALGLKTPSSFFERCKIVDEIEVKHDKKIKEIKEERGIE